MKRFILVTAAVLVLLLTGCGVNQAEYDALASERDSIAQELDELILQSDVYKTEIAEYERSIAQKDTEISAMKKELEELNLLADKYKALSDSEIIAQTEANKKKAEEDRIATEKLLAEEKEKKEAEAEAIRQAEEAEAKKGYETGITFNNLARTPDEYEGKKVKFSGRVIQVIEGTGEIDLRIATKGNYDDIIMVYYKSNIVSSRVLEDDVITIFGVSKGLYTYESTGGGPITVPLIAVDKIEQ